jgi:hypothetical protein
MTSHSPGDKVRVEGWRFLGGSYLRSYDQFSVELTVR